MAEVDSMKKQLLSGEEASSSEVPLKPVAMAPVEPGKAAEEKEGKAEAKELRLLVEEDEGETLTPGMTAAESARRWDFIQKIYGIVAAQLVLTAAVSSCFAFIPAVQGFALGSPAFIIVALVLPFLLFVPLYYFRHKHPHNLITLALWTVSLSMSVGFSCMLTQGRVVAEAVALTGAVLVGLSAYTFWAKKRGQQFECMGPFLHTALGVIILWGLLQLFFRPGPVVETLYALGGALLFSLYIIYDTESLMERFEYDEFVWASVALYLDIINLFIFIMRMLRR